MKDAQYAAVASLQKVGWQTTCETCAAPIPPDEEYCIACENGLRIIGAIAGDLYHRTLPPF